MTAISYVVSALPEPDLCLPAANSLRELCDANRTALAPHISAFGELHAGLSRIPVSVLCQVAMVVLIHAYSTGYGKKQDTSVNSQCDPSTATSGRNCTDGGARTLRLPL